MADSSTYPILSLDGATLKKRFPKTLYAPTVRSCSIYICAQQEIFVLIVQPMCVRRRAVFHIMINFSQAIFHHLVVVLLLVIHADKGFALLLQVLCTKSLRLSPYVPLQPSQDVLLQESF